MSFGISQAVKDYIAENGQQPEELVFDRDSDTGIKVLLLYNEEAPFSITLNGLKVTIK